MSEAGSLQPTSSQNVRTWLVYCAAAVCSCWTLPRSIAYHSATSSISLPRYRSRSIRASSVRWCIRDMCSSRPRAPLLRGGAFSSARCQSQSALT